MLSSTQTDANGNTMLQSFVSKVLKKIGWGYSRTTARGKTEKNACFLIKFFSRLHTAELVLSRWKLSTRWSKTAHANTDLRSRSSINPRPTRFVSSKAYGWKWRPRRCQGDPWSRKREIARGVLRSSPRHEMKYTIRHRRGIEFFCRLFPTNQLPNVFVSDAWPAPAT